MHMFQQRRIVKLSYFFLLSLFIAFGGCNKTEKKYSSKDELIEAIKPLIKQITIDNYLSDYHGSDKDYLLIDVRQKGEYDDDNIEGSVNIPRGILEFKLKDEAFWEEQFMYPPEDNTDIIIYCKKGSRGILATNSLNELGYKNVKNLEGGFLAFKEKGQKDETEDDE